jgi:release factor glutamine methyltransferase
MTIQLAYKQLLAQLYPAYDNREAANIADWVIEHVTGQRKIDRIVYKDLDVSAEQQKKLASITKPLLQHKPIQYVLNEAWFFDMKLYVNEWVLIPRPETEELIEWIVEEESRIPNPEFGIFILDIGTGSGCISIALKNKIKEAEVYALDVSDDALEVAKQNAVQQNAVIEFLKLNFLDESSWERLPSFNIIVSNPPYIRKSEEQTMAANVLQYEPHVALFVPDEDALKFYKAIAGFAQRHLKTGGSVFVEINEALGQQVLSVFKVNGFENVIIKKDLQGKDRMIKVSRY